MSLGGVDFSSRGGPQGYVSYQGLRERFSGLQMNLAGRHQYKNAAVVLAVLELLQHKGVPVPAAAIREGLAHTRWPGRLERLAQDPRIILDGAHNPEAARVLAQTLGQEQVPGRRLLVLGIMADKDVQAILSALLPLAQTVIFTQPQYFRAAKPDYLAKRAKDWGIAALQEPEVPGAIARALSLAGPRDQIVITGSLYTVGEAKAYFEAEGEK
jgi:dihydrofolate synthase/folylpolyglutamate synthase